VTTCRACLVDKQQRDFYRRSSGRLFSDCKACVSVKRKRRYEAEPETLKARAQQRARTPYGLFYTQLRNAMARGIDWDLTFDEWMEIWQASGKFAERGLRAGQYVMARNGDTGPYAVGNVKIITTEANIAERGCHSSSIKNFPEKGFTNACEFFVKGPE
jgi:hypothetical protein